IAGAPNGELCTCHLTQPLGLSQPTVSHHLRVLKEAGLIEVSRKIRTMTFYRLAPRGVGEPALSIGGRAVSAGGRGTAGGGGGRGHGGAGSRLVKRAYFVCIGNAGRSQMAQALYEELGGEARSAGSRPENELHQAVVEAMQEIDVDISDRRPKPITDEDVAW